jgi:hypothetical protein
MNPQLNIKKPNQIKTKCFQFNWVSWSNLYLGIVPRAAMAKTTRITTFIIKLKKGKHTTYFNFTLVYYSPK